MKKFKQNLGVMLVVGSLVLGCSSVDSEFKPSNEMEKQAYDFLKEKYPDIKIINYDFAYDFLKKEMEKDKNAGQYNIEAQIKDIKDSDKFKVVEYGVSNPYFIGTLYAETDDGKDIKSFLISCDEKNGKCKESEY